MAGDEHDQVSQSVGDNNDLRCFLIVSLMQKFDRSLKRYNAKLSEEYINFRLFQVGFFYFMIK